MASCECCERGYGRDVRVSFCPRCKSRKVAYIFGLGNLFGIIPKMRCKECGLSAGVFPILVSSEKELKRAVEGLKVKRKAVKKRKKVVKKIVKKKVVRRKK